MKTAQVGSTIKQANLLAARMYFGLMCGFHSVHVLADNFTCKRAAKTTWVSQVTVVSHAVADKFTCGTPAIFNVTCR